VDPLWRVAVIATPATLGLRALLSPFVPKRIVLGGDNERRSKRQLQCRGSRRAFCHLVA
jgi:hypothetical protein